MLIEPFTPHLKPSNHGARPPLNNVPTIWTRLPQNLKQDKKKLASSKSLITASHTKKPLWTLRMWSVVSATTRRRSCYSRRRSKTKLLKLKVKTPSLVMFDTNLLVLLVRSSLNFSALNSSRFWSDFSGLIIPWNYPLLMAAWKVCFTRPLLLWASLLINSI